MFKRQIAGIVFSVVGLSAVALISTPTNASFTSCGRGCVVEDGLYENYQECKTACEGYNRILYCYFAPVNRCVCANTQAEFFGTGGTVGTGCANFSRTGITKDFLNKLCLNPPYQPPPGVLWCIGGFQKIPCLQPSQVNDQGCSFPASAMPAPSALTDTASTDGSATPPIDTSTPPPTSPNCSTNDKLCVKLESNSFLNYLNPVDLVGKITGVILGIAGALALAFVVLGGIIWATSAGSEEKITKAKQMIFWAVIGLVVSIVSYLILQFVITTVQTAL